VASSIKNVDANPASEIETKSKKYIKKAIPSVSKLQVQNNHSEKNIALASGYWTPKNADIRKS
jgi:hypothetical protein